MDGRRTRWHSWDADFLGGKLGVGIRQRFGPVGITVFLGFISACKRNHVPGQITYHTDADALATMSLPGLRLVNEQGDEWALDTFWTYLGQQKVTSRRHRGDLTDVISTRWRRWQEDFGREVEATKKRRSRAGNTKTVPGRKPDDIPTDKDKDKDIDKDKQQPPKPPATEARTTALAVVVNGAVPQAEPIDKPTQVFLAWCESTGRDPNRTRLDPKRRKAVNDALKSYPLGDLIDAVQGWKHSTHHRGENDRGTIYNELALLLRDAAQIERFRDLQRHHGDRPALVVPQRMSGIASLMGGAGA